jgi:hypothetical protein
MPAGVRDGVEPGGSPAEQDEQAPGDDAESQAEDRTRRDAARREAQRDRRGTEPQQRRDDV